jgi:hypothetical protein
MPSPDGKILSCRIKFAADGKLYLRVQHPPDATLLSGFFPAQDTGEHERKEYKVRDECGEDKDSGAQDMTDPTKATDTAPSNCGYG